MATIRTSAEQTRRRHNGQADTNTATTPSTGKTEAARKISDEVARVLEDIDGVLEENAEEFVKSYVQRGGE